MIDFRYHLVSIIAIFMALAVGIVLGSGPLKDPIDNTLSQQADQLREQRNDLQEQVRQAEQRTAYDDDVISALAPGVTDGRLRGQRVVVVTAPGADPDLAASLAESVTGAGATVSGTVGVSDTWLDPANEEELDTVTSRLVLPGTTFPDDATARERLDTVLATGLVARTAGDQDVDQDVDRDQEPESDPGAQALLTGLEDLDYLTVEGTPSARGQLALVVAAPAPEEATDGTSTEDAGLLDLTAALDRLGGGTVVAGTAEATVEGGLVRSVRTDGDTDGSVSSVDTADSAAGRLSTVLALAAEVRGESGAYGFGPEAGAALPDLSAPPS